MWAKLGS